MAKVDFPHNLRIIPRIILVLLIIAAFGMSIAMSDSARESVKGTKVSENEPIQREVEMTLAVIEQRPDYAGAWLRLSVLYEQIGELELAKGALETAKKLNPDLN